MVAPAISRLDALGAVNENGVSAEENVNMEALFKELEYCYTMDSERQLHRQFVAEPETAGLTEDVWEEGRDHDLGDNVDLF